MTMTYIIYINYSPIFHGQFGRTMPKGNHRFLLISIKSNHHNFSLANLNTHFSNNFTHANQKTFLPHQTPIWQT
jgi:hypothetical protein